MSLGSVPNCQDVSGACPKPLGSSSEKKHNSSPQASKIFRISGLQSQGEGLDNRRICDPVIERAQ